MPSAAEPPQAIQEPLEPIDVSLAVQGAENVVVRNTSIVDKAAFAVVDLPVGATVFTERPLVLFSKRRCATPLYDAVDAIQVAHRFQHGLLYPCVHFLRLLPTVQAKIEAFFCPSREDNPESYDRYMRACRDLCRLHEFAGVEPERMVRLLWILRTNAHATGDGQASALFELGSKVTHSCNPNCMCTVDRVCVEYRAVRPIKPGDMITFSYIGGVDTIKSTPLRRRLLCELRYFSCCCNQCVGPDLCRAMICPGCKDPRTVHFQPGQPSFVPTTGQPTDRPWKCRGCKQEWRDADMPVQTEESLAAAVIKSFYDPFRQATYDQNHAKSLLAACEGQLGPFHCTVGLLLLACLALYHSAVQRGETGDKLDPPEVLLEWCRKLEKFLDFAKPDVMTVAVNQRFIAQTAVRFDLPYAARCYAKALPLLRVHWGPFHMHITEMEKTVRRHGDKEAVKRALENAPPSIAPWLSKRIAA